jgi:hypothetical protein
LACTAFLSMEPTNPVPRAHQRASHPLSLSVCVCVCVFVLSLELFAGSPDSARPDPDDDDEWETSDLSASERGLLTADSLHAGRRQLGGGGGEVGMARWGEPSDSSSGSDSPIPVSPPGSTEGPAGRKGSLLLPHPPLHYGSPLDRASMSGSGSGGGTRRRAGSLRDLLFNNSSSSHHQQQSPTAAGSPGVRKSSLKWGGASPSSARNSASSHHLRPTFQLPDLDEGTAEQEDGASGLERSIRWDDDVALPTASAGRRSRGRDNHDDDDDDDEYDGFASDDASLGDFKSTSPDGSFSLPSGDREDDGVAGRGGTGRRRGRGDPHNDGGGGSDFGAAMSTIDTSDFFDALEDQYLEALEGEHARTKTMRRRSSIRFADEAGVTDGDSGHPTGDGPAGAGALAAVAVTPSDRLDLYDEIRDSAHLHASKDGLNASLELDYRNDSDDDDDDASIYGEMFGDEDDSAKEEDEMKAQERTVIRGFLYSIGGMALLGGIGWVAQKIMAALGRGNDDDGGVAANPDVMTADRGADVGHAGELTADTAKVIDLAAEGAIYSKGTVDGSQGAMAASFNNGTSAQGSALSGSAGNANAGAAAAAQ